MRHKFFCTTFFGIVFGLYGFETDDSVILIAATNRPDVLDKALLRPGRFDRQIVVDVPSLEGREAILKIHTRNIPISKDVDLKVINKRIKWNNKRPLLNK